MFYLRVFRKVIYVCANEKFSVTQIRANHESQVHSLTGYRLGSFNIDCGKTLGGKPLHEHRMQYKSLLRLLLNAAGAITLCVDVDNLVHFFNNVHFYEPPDGGCADLEHCHKEFNIVYSIKGTSKFLFVTLSIFVYNYVSLSFSIFTRNIDGFGLLKGFDNIENIVENWD